MKKTNNIIHNKQRQIVSNSDEKYRIVKEHFKEQFYDESKKSIERFVGEPRRLNNKITVEEVEKATKRLKNNKAAGDDNIPPELYEYAPT